MENSSKKRTAISILQPGLVSACPHGRRQGPYLTADPEKLLYLSLPIPLPAPPKAYLASTGKSDSLTQTLLPSQMSDTSANVIPRQYHVYDLASTLAKQQPRLKYKLDLETFYTALIPSTEAQFRLEAQSNFVVSGQCKFQTQAVRLVFQDSANFEYLAGLSRIHRSVSRVANIRDCTITILKCDNVSSTALHLLLKSISPFLTQLEKLSIELRGCLSPENDNLQKAVRCFLKQNCRRVRKFSFFITQHWCRQSYAPNSPEDFESLSARCSCNHYWLRTAFHRLVRQSASVVVVDSKSPLKLFPSIALRRFNTLQLDMHEMEFGIGNIDALRELIHAMHCMVSLRQLSITIHLGLRSNFSELEAASSTTLSNLRILRLGFKHMIGEDAEQQSHDFLAAFLREKTELVSLELSYEQALSIEKLVFTLPRQVPKLRALYLRPEGAPDRSELVPCLLVHLPQLTHIAYTPSVFIKQKINHFRLQRICDSLDTHQLQSLTLSSSMISHTLIRTCTNLISLHLRDDKTCSSSFLNNVVCMLRLNSSSLRELTLQLGTQRSRTIDVDDFNLLVDFPWKSMQQLKKVTLYLATLQLSAVMIVSLKRLFKSLSLRVHTLVFDICVDTLSNMVMRSAIEAWIPEWMRLEVCAFKMVVSSRDFTDQMLSEVVDVFALYPCTRLRDLSLTLGCGYPTDVARMLEVRKRLRMIPRVGIELLRL